MEASVIERGRRYHVPLLRDATRQETTMSDFDPSPRIAEELKLSLRAVRAVAQLLADGATVPFIARYRKEQTGGLDEVAIRAVEEKREVLLELAARRQTILRAIEAQGKLTPELHRDVEAC